MQNQAYKINPFQFLHNQIWLKTEATIIFVNKHFLETIVNTKKNNYFLIKMGEKKTKKMTESD